MPQETDPVVGKISPQDIAARAGSANATVNMGDVSDKVQPISKDPTEVLAKRVGQQRDSMIGSLLGAYLSMTSYDPTEVELVQSVKEDGSIGFRFKPRSLESPDMLWALCARHTVQDKEMFGIVQVFSPGVSEQAARAAASSIEAQLREQQPEGDISVQAMQTRYVGFVEDLVSTREVNPQMIVGSEEDIIEKVDIHPAQEEFMYQPKSGRLGLDSGLGDNDSWTGPDTEED